MKYVIKYLCVVALALFMCRCTVWGIIYNHRKDLHAWSTIKYTSDKTLDDKIRFDGYYSASGTYPSITDSTYTYFYKDEDIAFMKDNPAFWHHDKINAVAEITGDTLIVNRYTDGEFWVMSVWGYKFLIKDCRTLNLIEVAYPSSPINISMENSWRRPIDSMTLHFHPLDSVPVYENPLKEKKWMWENKEDWKQWKKEQKRLKKERKLKSKGQTKQKYDPYAPDMNRGRDNQSIN